MLLRPLRGLTGFLRSLRACSATCGQTLGFRPKPEAPSAISVRQFTPLTHQLGGNQSLLSPHPGPDQSGQIIKHYSMLLHQTQGCVHRPLLGAAPTTLQQVRTYKVRHILKRRCKGCYFEKREGRWFVECTLKPRHKQMQKLSQKNVYKDDYSKGNVRLAAHWGWRKKRFYWEGDSVPRDFYKPLIDYRSTSVRSPS